ncbi:Solute carrier organic anion transporter family member 2A1 [Toxocara canis]|uniref:Solute carrier organic anion transporter family member n=2 Tax=Toxocara canis TaxID=6265 RepID=A0A0B2W031_TOXCA|nr:Solute carrier organic anion transporter family member 2A1 [Toxocara canis]VDM42929.1 unnamed protein product [Toxocara canis]
MPKKTRLTITIFLIVMLVVIGIQGTYLGYTVGILTNLERRFGISSKNSGTLLSIYDIGHTVAVVLVGFLANGRNLPRMTAIGVVLSAASMFFLALPAAIFGTVSTDLDSLNQHRQEYISENICDPYRTFDITDEHCIREHKEEVTAFHILSAGQFLAGVAAAPFNTIAYVYIDDNLENKALSPFYLGLLSSMYAFGPAFGFALSAGLTRVYSSITGAPPNLDINSEEWVGAWWLGFLICGMLYLFCSVPLFFFPRSLIHPDEDPNSLELHQLRHEQLHLHTHHDHELVVNEEAPQKISFLKQLKDAIEDLPYMAWDLLKNPVYTSMVIGWMFGSYLVGGYSTYLPKYIETQYARSASAADMYAGIISIGSIAVSTALGGYILTRFNLSPRNAILCLIGSWLVILASYLLGMTVGCDEPAIKELVMQSLTARFEFRDISECNIDCNCASVYHFNAVHYNTTNFFSPCHAGCHEFNSQLDKWDKCSCANNGAVESGLYLEECNQIFAYIVLMFIGLFFGNLFFMTTMMVILRAVHDCEKVMALSFASCITNVLGFIPAPIIFGWLIDSACILWRSRCPNDHGNCIVYDNKFFRQTFHFSNAVVQLFAVISIIVCYLFIRKRILPEEEQPTENERNAFRAEPIQTAL